MWEIIRALITILLSVEMLIGSTVSGSIFKNFEMLEAQASEYTQYVDPFIGTGGSLVRVFRSADLEMWEEYGTLHLPEGMGGFNTGICKKAGKSRLFC